MISVLYKNDHNKIDNYDCTSTMAISTAPLCLFILGALCLANTATAIVQRDTVDAAKFFYDALSLAQVQEGLGPSGPPGPPIRILPAV